MTIQEAIQSGKPFRRPHWRVDAFVQSHELACAGLHEHDILATDWEIKEVATPITRSQFFQAVADILKEAGVEYYGLHGKRYPQANDIMEFKDWKQLADRLGL